jgi:hypothetical protein
MNLNSNGPKVGPSKSKPLGKGAFGISGGYQARRHMNCAHCNRLMNDFAGGYSRGHHNEPLCHPNTKDRPDCYKLVTLYNHESPCISETCYENHKDFMVYVKAHPNFQEPKTLGIK